MSSKVDLCLLKKDFPQKDNITDIFTQKTTVHKVTNFRFLCVCHASMVFGHEGRLGKKFAMISLLFSAAVGLCSAFYRENALIYLLCMGREEQFKFDISSNFFHELPNGFTLNLDGTHPLAMVYISAFSFIFITPVVYFKIFRFRKSQDGSVQGIS